MQEVANGLDGLLGTPGPARLIGVMLGMAWTARAGITRDAGTARPSRAKPCLALAGFGLPHKFIYFLIGLLYSLGFFLQILFI